MSRPVKSGFWIRIRGSLDPKKSKLIKNRVSRPKIFGKNRDKARDIGKIRPSRTSGNPLNFRKNRVFWIVLAIFTSADLDQKWTRDFTKIGKTFFFLSQCLKVPRQIFDFLRFFSSFLCYFSKKKADIPCLVSIFFSKKSKFSKIFRKIQKFSKKNLKN